MRSKAIDPKDLAKAPGTFKTVDMTGNQGAKFRIQVSAADCTGCGSCTKVCPANKNKDKQALVMKPINERLAEEKAN
ncbi:MAG: 4Fe-4S dicluster domain-containing protein [Mycoplasmoidaceae bacterium]|nr:4Fe-4S dicluster domain-containing protein [Mycoplasmoidaceae bacterium]